MCPSHRLLRDQRRGHTRAFRVAGLRIAGVVSVTQRVLEKFGDLCERGIALVLRLFQNLEVDPKHTSQTCSSCSYVDPQSRKSQARFECIACGMTMNADVNAAVNILNRGLNRASLGVEDRGCPADEALTHWSAA